MAEINDTSTKRTDKEMAYYASLPPQQRADLALEMANEIKEAKSQQYVLATLITQHLAAPDDSENIVNPMAYRLAQVLEQSLEEFGQMYRLVKCITAVVNAEGGAA